MKDKLEIGMKIGFGIVFIWLMSIIIGCEKEAVEDVIVPVVEEKKCDCGIYTEIGTYKIIGDKTESECLKIEPSYVESRYTIIWCDEVIYSPDPLDQAQWSEWSEWTNVSSEDPTQEHITQERYRTCEIEVVGNADATPPSCDGEDVETQEIDNPNYIPPAFFESHQGVWVRLGSVDKFDKISIEGEDISMQNMLWNIVNNYQNCYTRKTNLLTMYPQIEWEKYEIIQNNPDGIVWQHVDDPALQQEITAWNSGDKRYIEVVFRRRDDGCTDNFSGNTVLCDISKLWDRQFEFHTTDRWQPEWGDSDDTTVCDRNGWVPYHSSVDASSNRGGSRWVNPLYPNKVIVMGYRSSTKYSSGIVENTGTFENPKTGAGYLFSSSDVNLTDSQKSDYDYMWNLAIQNL